jgi:glycosyltransferase involved in cell wall biosynthesis
VFHPDHFAALTPRWLESSHALGLSYYHGRPGTPGHPEFDRAFEALRRHRARVDRIQVTHAEMYDLVLSAGVDPAAVFRIPIGVDLEHFPLADASARATARAELDVPSSAFVVGSFQKDGVGMGEGLAPKAVKGPDTLVATLERVHAETPDLFVLLTGHARGYVRRELERLRIPHRHVLLGSRAHLARAYATLDVYLVTSRQDGGPKGVLEAMASGVPVVTTRVGQAQELVTDGTGGLLADVEDVVALADALGRVRDDSALAARLAGRGRATAETNADERLDGRWAELLDGLVHRGGDGAG